MNSLISKFEAVVRKSSSFSSTMPTSNMHPFDERYVHPKVIKICKSLFDDGHFSQATFEAFKYVDNTVAKIAKSDQSGVKLMMKAFNQDNPVIQLSNLCNTSEIDEQKGYSFLFAGAVMAIRNPRGHDVGTLDSIDQCLDHLCFASMLLRRLDDRILSE